MELTTCRSLASSSPRGLFFPVDKRDHDEIRKYLTLAQGCLIEVPLLSSIAGVLGGLGGEFENQGSKMSDIHETPAERKPAASLLFPKVFQSCLSSHKQK